MRASIIIPVYNRCDDLRECLEALPEEMLKTFDSEVLVVDDGSTDEVGNMLEIHFPHVRYLKTSGRLGPGCARNLAAHEAQGELLVFLDSDAVPESHWLSEFLTHDDGHTLLGGRIVDYFDGSPQYGPRRSTFIGKSISCKPCKANMGPAGNLAVPRQCFDSVNGFWEEISFAFEDSFLSICAKRKGFPFKYLEDATVRHKGSVKREGNAIYATEHNGVFAMLSTYRNSWWKVFIFSFANGSWLLLRLFLWTFSGRYRDVRLLFGGWLSAYRRFLSQDFEQYKNNINNDV